MLKSIPVSLSRVLCFAVFFIAVGCSSSDDNEANADTENSEQQQNDELDALIVGRAWDLSAYTALDGSLVDVIPETHYQFILDPSSSSLTGFLECVNTNGSYELGDGFVRIRFGTRDGVLCDVTSDPGHLDQVRSINSILSSQSEEDGTDTPLMWLVDVQGNLLLSTPDGRQLIWTEVETLMQQQ